MNSQRTQKRSANQALRRARMAQFSKLHSHRATALTKHEVQELFGRKTRPASVGIPNIRYRLPKSFIRSQSNARHSRNLFQLWHEVVGKKFARLTAPGRLVVIKGRAPSLQILSTSAAASLIAHDLPMITSRIAHILGTQDMPKLSIVQVSKQQVQAEYKRRMKAEKKGIDEDQNRSMTPAQRDRLNAVGENDLEAALALLQDVMKPKMGKV